MTKEDVGTIINIITLVLVIGFYLDEFLFRKKKYLKLREETIKNMIEECKESNRCILCNRPMIVTDE